MRANTIVRKLPFFLMLVIPLILAGCEGDPGPAGPAGPAGPSGVDFEYTYVGTKGTPCNHCHANVVADVLLTKHTHAYHDLATELLGGNRGHTGELATADDAKPRPSRGRRGEISGVA